MSIEIETGLNWFQEKVRKGSYAEYCVIPLQTLEWTKVERGSSNHDRLNQIKLIPPLHC